MIFTWSFYLSANSRFVDGKYLKASVIKEVLFVNLLLLIGFSIPNKYIIPFGGHASFPPEVPAEAEMTTIAAGLKEVRADHPDDSQLDPAGKSRKDLC